MFLKQFNYKPRSNSQSSSDSMPGNDSPSSGAKGSASSHNAEPGAVRGGSGTTATPATNTGGERRRSSVGTGFAGLTSQKRTGDAASDAKKAAFMEQKPGSGGPISNMWNNFTKGPTGAG